ncbi:ferredoxin [bacterium DOLZORAL124_64_63]|nr:MAG: ferredoxin [bacterium DOLZORAL124_64_63]
MSYKIQDIEGIGPAFAEKLAAAEITTTDDLLQRASDPAGRKAIAEATGLNAAQILKWANMADLMRINGVGGQYSELLKGAGVDTIKELRTRNAANLAAKMKEVNGEKKLAKNSPSESMVAGWIETAKGLDPKLTY